VAKPAWENQPGSLLVLSGDVPLITAATLEKLVGTHQQSGAGATILTTLRENPGNCGRLVRNQQGGVEAIVEHKDATLEQREIREINTGICILEIAPLAGVMAKLSADNVQKEYFLTDCIALLREQGFPVGAVVCDDPMEVEKVNSRADLARLGKWVREKTLAKLMQAGVTLLDPASTYVDIQVEIGNDTVLYPNVFLEGKTRIGSNCRIYPHCRIRNSVLEEEVTILDCTVIEEALVRKGAQLGPFARLRPKTEIGEEARIGNFVEVKNSRIGKHSKAQHHSYLGDADIGENVNVGAGTITCNYDGIKKSRTTIGDGAFIGSDTQLIAPVKVGRGAYVAAGSSICEDVPEESLGIARARQVNKEGWARKRREGRDGKSETFNE
jgi:bifunctional UDP-N-acetylglucosamine pyrophosphorylase/glucosamine-1-phosphate N-acetyltransferase